MKGWWKTLLSICNFLSICLSVSFIHSFLSPYYTPIPSHTHTHTHTINLYLLVALSPNVNENKRQWLRQQFILIHDNFLKSNIVTMIHEMWNQYQLRLGKLLNFPVNPPSPRTQTGEIHFTEHPASNTVWRCWSKLYHIQCNSAMKSSKWFCFQTWWSGSEPELIEIKMSLGCKKQYRKKLTNIIVFFSLLNFESYILFCF